MFPKEFRSPEADKLAQWKREKDRKGRGKEWGQVTSLCSRLGSYWGEWLCNGERPPRKSPEFLIQSAAARSARLPWGAWIDLDKNRLRCPSCPPITDCRRLNSVTKPQSRVTELGWGAWRGSQGIDERQTWRDYLGLSRAVSVKVRALRAQGTLKPLRAVIYIGHFSVPESQHLVEERSNTYFFYFSDGKSGCRCY